MGFWGERGWDTEVEEVFGGTSVNQSCFQVCERMEYRSREGVWLYFGKLILLSGELDRRDTEVERGFCCTSVNAILLSCM